MKVMLICDQVKRKLIEEIFKMKKIEINENSDIVFVEKGFENKSLKYPFIIFDSSDLNSIINFIDNLKERESFNDKVIAGKSKESFELFSYEKIQFFEADNNNVYCINEDDPKPYKVKEKLYELEEKLDKNIFIRVSKSNIVNIMNISQIVPWFGAKLLLKFKGSSRNIEVTRTYIKDFKKHLGM